MGSPGAVLSAGCGQLIQALAPVAILPAFETWHSGALPYPLLVAAQLAIIAVYARIAWGIQAGRTRPDLRLGRWLLGFGSVYGGFMVVRLVLGATVARQAWFDAPIPSVFHLVLAAFLLVTGRFHIAGPTPAARSPEPR